MTPEDLLKLQGKYKFFDDLLWKDACFAHKSGQVINNPESIRRTLQNFIDIGRKLEVRVKRVLHASNLALVIAEWSINGTEPNDKPTNLIGRGTAVLRQQSDGAWLIVIENPWRTD